MSTVRHLGRSLWRRWYVALPMAVLTVAVTAALARAIPTEHEARSMVSLLAARNVPRGAAGRPDGENSFLSPGPALGDTADLLVRRLDSPAAAARLRADGVTESYEAGKAANIPGPFLTLTVTGTNPAKVAAGLRILLGYTARQLTAIQQQAGVSPAAMIRSFVVIAPTRPAAQPARKLPAVLGIAVVGLLVAMLSALLAEAVAAARRAMAVAGPQALADGR